MSGVKTDFFKVWLDSDLEAHLLQQTRKRQTRRAIRKTEQVTSTIIVAVGPIPFLTQVIKGLKKARGKKVPVHLAVLHTSVSSRFGHVAPPSFASWTTSLVLVLVPPSQVTLQSPHADQSPTLQSNKDRPLPVRKLKIHS